MRPLDHFMSYFRSGWSFFFRWPCVHTDDFRPLGLYLGPFFQVAVALFGAALFFSLYTIGGFKNFENAHLFLGLLMLSAWTGFFHEDGLADTADGFGPARIKNDPQNLERIIAAMKDSRLGTYGVSAVVILWLARYEFLWKGSLTLGDLGLALLWSRSFGLGIGGLVISEKPPGASGHTLGSLTRNARLRSFALLLAISIVPILIQFQSSQYSLLFHFSHRPLPLLVMHAAGALLCSTLLIWFKKRTLLLNGDHIGAAICITEIFFLYNFSALS